MGHGRFFVLVFCIGLLIGTTALGQVENLSQEVDVCIYGATPSGIYAAVAVAREGKRALLVEPSRWLGGMLGAGIKPKQDCPMPAAVGGLMGEGLSTLGNQPAEIRESFRELLRQHNVAVLFEYRVKSVRIQRERINAIDLEYAPPDDWGVPAARPSYAALKSIVARVFIDASYEGELMARAGVQYAIGREAKEEYDEVHAGVQKLTNVTPISPFKSPGDPSSGFLKWVESDHGRPLGASDLFTQAYNFRYYVTDDPNRRVRLTAPVDYNAADYELVGRYVTYLVQRHKRGEGPPPRLDQIFPGWLNSGEYNYFRQHLVTIAPLGVSRTYQDGDYATRARIWRWHIDYLRGLHHFLSTDERVPAEFRQQTAKLGLDRTHHPETAGWPHQLYVRVCRRMLGRYVLTEADVFNKTRVDDSIGLALYGVDTYPVRRIAVADPQTGEMNIATEGNMFIGGNRGTGVPYRIPYRAITPNQADCRNLLVPVCFSASYIAYASSRMEPVFGILGESAGVASTLAIDEGVDVQAIDVTRLQKRLRQYGQVLDPKAAMARQAETKAKQQTP